MPGLLVTWLCGALLAAAPAPRLSVVPLDQVRPGLRGQGLTVFAGSESVSFDVEVLGVLRDFAGPGLDIIVARLSGDAVTLHGVASGMSGSPVWVDGRLLGAVSYRLGAFAKEPIAGITPAEFMLAAASDRVRPRASAPAAAGAGTEGVSVAGGWRGSSPAGDLAGLSLVPIETPLVVGGAPPGFLERYADRLRGRGLTPVRGASAGRAPVDRPASFFAGGPMAGVLISGDLTIAAIGTVTAVDGDRIIGFGHPFLGRGASELPLATAEVVTTIPSLLGSSKIGNAGPIVGTLTDDRSAGVAGRIGLLPHLVPVEVTVAGPAAMLARDRRRQIRFEVFRDPDLTPLLCEMAIGSALGGRVGFDAGGGARLRLTLGVAGQRPLLIEDTVAVSEGGSIAATSAALIGALLQELWKNPFCPLDGLRVDLEIDFDPALRATTVIGARVTPPAARPGSRVTVAVELLDHRGKRRIVEQRLLLPATLEPGETKLHVGGCAELAPVDKNSGRLFTPTSLADVWRNLAARRRGDRLYLTLVRAAPGMQVAGRSLPALPPSLQGILARGSDGSERRRLSQLALFEHAIDTGAPVDKGVVLDLDILPPESEP
ncbi:MAG: hypothetical protein JXR83_14285 [Deltaproteobacteria bacterium]|nr:hypothetical protein [Deltaproteobacteria bacterium]